MLIRIRVSFPWTITYSEEEGSTTWIFFFFGIQYDKQKVSYFLKTYGLGIDLESYRGYSSINFKLLLFHLTIIKKHKRKLKLISNE